MRQVLNDIALALALAPLMGIFVYCFLAEDPMQVEISRQAEAEARTYDLERQRE